MEVFAEINIGACEIRGYHIDKMNLTYPRVNAFCSQKVGLIWTAGNFREDTQSLLVMSLAKTNSRPAVNIVRMRDGH